MAAALQHFCDGVTIISTFTPCAVSYRVWRCWV